MQSEIFKGTYEGLKARIDAILATRTVNQVVKLSGGTYLILHT